MQIEEIIEQAHLYFGKDRAALKEKILAFKFDGAESRRWQRQLKSLTAQPCEVSYGIFDDVVQWLNDKQYDEINWDWLGDLSWEIQILLNENVKRGLDWDKRLATACGGTARILHLRVSDIIPCFVVDVYYFTYSRRENYYEFGALRDLSITERKLMRDSKRFLQNLNYTFLNRREALRRHTNLISDVNDDGGATLFDALFANTQNYQRETNGLMTNR